MQITFATRKKNTGFYVLRQGVPEGRSSEGYASFKQRERDRQTDRQTETERHRARQRQTDRQTDRQTETETETDRQTDREKDSDSDYLFTKFYNKESVSKAVSIQT